MIDPARQPHDVDALARHLPRPEPGAERSAAMRHAILDAAQASPEIPVRGRGRRWASGAITAAAAAVCLWAVLRSPQRAALRPPAMASRGQAPVPPHAAEPPRSPAGSGDAPGSAAAVERLREGVTAFAPTRPLQLASGDATITAPPDARFEVEVHGDEVKHVTVTAGWIVIASSRATTTVVPAQHTWTPEALSPVATPTAQRAPSAPDAAPPAIAQRAPATPPITPSITPSITPAGALPAWPWSLPDAARRSPPSLPSLPAVPSQPPPAPAAAAPGTSVPSLAAPASTPPGEAPGAGVVRQRPTPDEHDFRDGLRTLLAGNPRAATAALDRACSARSPSSSQDDICYWAAVAWLRSGERDHARRALADLLARWPDATHAGEASVALGWLLLDAGDRTGARTRFAAAVNDRVPTVRANALRGLAAAQ